MASSRRFKAFLDVIGRVWTLRRVLQNRRLQVRFLSHLPLGNPETKPLQAIKRWSDFCVYLGH